MKTITHVFKTYFPDTQGGLEEAIRQIGKYSLEKGFNVNVISISKNPSNSILSGINCKSYKYTLGPKSMPISISLATNFKEIIENTDILQLHYPYPYGELLALCHKINKPIIITFHGEMQKRKLFNLFYKPFSRLILKKASFIVPTSENLVKSVSNLRNIGDKTRVINLWFDESRFKNLDDVDSNFKNKVNKYGRFTIFIGVLRWYKGLDILLDSAKSTVGNIVIVGNGPLKEHLELRLKEEKINNVFLTGYLPDNEVQYLLKQSLFSVLPSISPAEAFGQVLLESCYFSKPMISTELGTGTSFVNLNNNTGFVVQPNDSNALSVAMNNLFNNSDLLNLMSRNAFLRYKNYFTDAIQGEKYINLYNQLLNK